MTSPAFFRRRSFIKRVGRFTSAAGAILGGLAPELRAAPLAGASPAPASADTPLPLAEQNALYAAALSDPDVLAITGLFGQPLRLDPPRSGGSADLGSGQSLTSVVLPLVSYATGAAVAYLYFGQGSLRTEDGRGVTLPVRLAIGSDGLMRMGLGGTAQVISSPASAPETGRALFAGYFPDEYIAQLDRQRIGAARGSTRLALQPGQMQRVMQAENGDPGKLEKCRAELRDCLSGPYYACLAGSAGLVLCAVGTASCFFPPLLGMTCWGSIQLCVAAAGAFTACLVVITSCSAEYQHCKRLARGGGGVGT